MKIKTVICAVGGYGSTYVDYCLDHSELEIVAFVDPAAEKAISWNKIEDSGVPIYKNLEEFYENGSADLVIISSPIGLHCPHSVIALENGSHVLCEKPSCSSKDDFDKMITAQEESGKFLAIGYQDSYYPENVRLKKDILSGRFGKPVKGKCFVLSPRDDTYYNRNNWAGKRLSHSGEPILDSPVNNAFSHFLHNMFYLLGDNMLKALAPVSIEVETYKVNPIETFDTIALRVLCENEIPLHFYASHAVLIKEGPVYELHFEKGILYYEGFGESVVAKDGDEIIDEYDIGDCDHMVKVEAVIESIRNGTKPDCCIESTQSHLDTILMIDDAIQEGKAVEGTFKVKEEGENVSPLTIKGLNNLIMEAFEEEKLFSEMGVPWAMQKCSSSL